MVQNASVELTFGGSTSGVTTGSDGVFRFEVNLNASSDDGARIAVTKAGFIQKIVNFTVVSDTNLVVAMSVDFSTSTWVKGVLRDSVTSFPLRNALILLTLPGVVDQYVTAVDGKFIMAANRWTRIDAGPPHDRFDGYKVKPSPSPVKGRHLRTSCSSRRRLVDRTGLRPRAHSSRTCRSITPPGS